MGVIARFLGLDTLVVYAILALLAGGGIWAWSAHKYNSGYSAGETHERQAWEKEKALLIRLAEVERKVAQTDIDRLAQEVLAQEARADDSDAQLDEARHASKTKDDLGLPRAVGQVLNRVGR